MNDDAQPGVTGFQRDVLAVVAQFEAGEREPTYSEGPYGSEIGAALEAAYSHVVDGDEAVDTGRLYPALGKLADRGFLTTEPIEDARDGMEAYTLSDSGLRWLLRRRSVLAVP